jgi:hypothetical protein
MKAIVLIAAVLAVGVAANPGAAESSRSLPHGLDKLGFERNIDLNKGSGAGSSSPVSAIDITRHDGLDIDRNGSISRREYLIGRTRGGRVSRFSPARQRHHQRRLESRFRAADQNRDGRITADELRGVRDPRF